MTKEEEEIYSPKHLQQMDSLQQAKWNEFANNYTRDTFVAYYGNDKVLDTPIGKIQIRIFPSGTKYAIMWDGRLEKLTPQWFAKIERLFKEQEQNANTDKTLLPASE